MHLTSHTASLSKTQHRTVPGFSPHDHRAAWERHSHPTSPVRTALHSVSLGKAPSSMFHVAAAERALPLCHGTAGNPQVAPWMPSALLLPMLQKGELRLRNTE